MSARCRPRGTKIEWFPPPTLPQVGEGPKEAESRYRRSPPTPVCREEVGLTSWLGKPLHQPARMEQARVLRHPLEFRKLPCIRGCRLTGLVASSGCRPERGMKPLREREREREGGGWVSGVVGGEGSDLPGTWTPPSNVGKIRGREGEDSGSSSYHRGFMVEADGAWGSRQK